MAAAVFTAVHSSSNSNTESYERSHACERPSFGGYGGGESSDGGGGSSCGDSGGTFSGVIGKTPFEIKISYPLVSILFKGCNEEFVAFTGSMYAPRQSNPSRVAHLVAILLFILKNDEGVSKQVEDNLQCGYILGECLFSARKELVLLEMVEKTSIKKAAVAAEESLKKVNGMLKSVDAIVTAWKADFDEKQPSEVVDKNGAE